MSKLLYHTLTSLIGKDNHKTFKDAAVELGMLKKDYSPAPAWKEHLTPVTRNTPNGPVQGYKYTQQFVNTVLDARPSLVTKLFSKAETAIKGHQSLTQYIGSTGHGPFKDILVAMEVLDEQGGCTGRFKGHIKKRGFYNTYSVQLIVKVCNDHPEVLSLYPQLRDQINPIRTGLGLPEIELPELEKESETEEMVHIDLV